MAKNHAEIVRKGSEAFRKDQTSKMHWQAYMVIKRSKKKIMKDMSKISVDNLRMEENNQKSKDLLKGNYVRWNHVNFGEHIAKTRKRGLETRRPEKSRRYTKRHGGTATRGVYSLQMDKGKKRR